MPKDVLSTASRSVLRVGGGRGFVVKKNGERFVITAAHCLTVPVTVYGDTASKGATLPPAHAGSHSKERTYPRLLGPLGAEPHVSVEAVFCDPVSDLAVLGPVDRQELYAQAMAYDELVKPLDQLPLGSLTFTYRRHTPPVGDAFVDPMPTAESDAWLLALDRHWFHCRVASRGRALWISEAQDDIRSGMSGSPIVSPAGHAIGVVCNSHEVVGHGGRSREGGPNPFLAAQLPGWLAGGRLKIARRPRVS